MTANQKALELIRQFEGCCLTSYQDTGGVWTVGYGATGTSIHKNTVWTQEQAEKDLESRVNALSIALGHIVHLTLNDNEFAALLSLAYNIGLTAFSKSTMLKLINAGAVKQAADEFEKWDKVGSKVIQGLLNRRAAEKRVYLS